MSFYLGMVIKSLKIFSREPIALFWALGFPIVVLFIFGFINFGGTDPVRIGIVDNANNNDSREFIASIEAISREGGPIFEINEEYANESELIRDFDIGDEIEAALVIERGTGNQELQVELKVDVNQPAQSKIAEIAILQLISEPSENAFDNLRITEYKGNALSFTDFLIPAVASMGIMQTMVFGLVFSLVGFKVQNILRQLQITPVGPVPLVVGAGVSRILVSVAQVYIMLILGSLIFGISVAENGNFFSWIIFGIIALLGSFVFLGIGLLVASIARDQGAAGGLAAIVTVPQLFPAGVFFSRTLFPESIRGIIDFLPLSLIVDAVQAVSIRSAGIGEIWLQLLLMLVWGVVLFTAGSMLFRRRASSI